jgi:hypothetical protein
MLDHSIRAAAGILATCVAAEVLYAQSASEEQREFAVPEEREIWFEEHIGHATELYGWLHQHPEISGQEADTAGRLTEEWKHLGVEVTTSVESRWPSNA